MKVDFVFVLFVLYEGCSAAKLGVDECQTKLSDLATQHDFNITQGCSAAKLGVDECQTKLSDLATQHDFNITQFTGVWYTHASTTYVYGDHTWDSMTNMLFVHNDGTVTSVTSGHDKSNKICRTATIYMSKSGTAEYTGQFMGGTVTFKVLHTDYNITAMFYCFHVNDDGTCDHKMSQLELWSRKPDHMSKDDFENISTYAYKIPCTDVIYLRVMAQGTCEAPVSAEPQGVAGVCQNSPIDNMGLAEARRALGDLQTVLIGVEEGEQPRATSYKGIPGSDSNTFYVLSSYQRGKTCSAVKVEKYQRILDNHYLQLGTSIPTERWAFRSQTGEVTIFLCYQRTGGHCSKSEVQVLIEHGRPVSLDALEMIKENIGKRYCQKYNMFVDQSVGLCTVPELLGNIVLLSDAMRFASKSIPLEAVSQMQKHPCKLSDIPVQKGLHLSQLSGLWYEISRPRNVLNQFQSSVAYYQHRGNNSIHSTYSGSINNKCSPAISSYTKPIDGNTIGAEMEARLDGPEDVFPWLPFKIIYNDGMYSLHYGCFRTDDNGNCLQAEASIYGRRPTIDIKMKEKLYSMFPSLCLLPEYMDETIHTGDCSEWVIPHTDTNTEQRRCNVHDIPFQNLVSMELMTGSWYVIASSNWEANRVDIRREDNSFVAVVFRKENGECRLVSMATMVRNKHNENGDILVAVKRGNVRPLYSMKIIYTDYKVALVYECVEEDIHGGCSSSGTRVIMISRTKTIDSMTRSILEAKLKLPCGDLSNVETVTEHCDKGISCLVDDIPVMENLDKQRISGVWYDILRPSPINYTAADSAVLRFDVDEHGDINGVFVSLSPNGTCRKHSSSMRQRYNGGKGEFLTMRLSPSETNGFFPFKIVYTDYDNIMVPYVCLDTQLNGKCNDNAKRMRILSRTKTITPEVKGELMKYFDIACIETDTLVETNHDVDCSSMLV